MSRARALHNREPIELIFNPGGVGEDTGYVVSNVQRIMDSDLVLFDVSPNKMRYGKNRSKDMLNPGTMIEYGMVLALDRPSQGRTPWYGRLPRPIFVVFSQASRTRVTPILNEVSIKSFRKGMKGRKELVKSLVSVIERKLGQSLPPNTQVTIGAPANVAAQAVTGRFLDTSGSTPRFEISRENVPVIDLRTENLALREADHSRQGFTTLILENRGRSSVTVTTFQVHNGAPYELQPPVTIQPGTEGRVTVNPDPNATPEPYEIGNSFRVRLWTDEGTEFVFEIPFD